MDDVDIDNGYKWTFPVIYGVGISKWVVIFMYTVALVFMLIVSIKTLIGVPFLATSIIMMARKKKHKLTKRVGDIGIALVLISFLF
jgi:hypothetical protein